MSERPDTTVTVLSGDLLGNDAGTTDEEDYRRSDNAFTVLVVENVQDVRLERLTITGGNGTERTAEYRFKVGGGIRIEDAERVELVDVTIVANTSGRGAGLYMNRAEVLVTGSHFERNVVGSRLVNPPSGGAVYSRASTWRIERSTFLRNRAYRGGAINSDDAALNLLANNTFIANSAHWGGGALWLHYAPTWIINSGFYGNEAEVGGAGFLAIGSDITVFGSVFSGNQVRSGTGGAGFYAELSNVDVVNCTFYGNETAAVGRAMQGWHNDTLRVLNTVSRGGAGSLRQDIRVVPVGPNPSVSHSLLEVELEEFEYNSIGPVWTLEDAIFESGEGADGVVGTADDLLALAPGSPGTARGNPDFVPLDIFDVDRDGDVLERIPVDIHGNPRVGPGGKIDLGAFQAGSGMPVQVVSTERPQFRVEVYPNPFDDELHVAIPLGWARSAKVVVELFDLVGRLVRRSSEDMNTVPGQFSISGLRDLPAGVFLLRVHAPGQAPHSLLLVHHPAERQQ